MLLSCIIMSLCVTAGILGASIILAALVTSKPVMNWYTKRMNKMISKDVEL